MRIATTFILGALLAPGCGNSIDVPDMSPPPPLVCANVVSGQSLSGTATADATSLTVSIGTSTKVAHFFGPLVNDLRGLKERTTVIGGNGMVQATFDRVADAADGGSGTPPDSVQFTLRAKLISDTNQCDLQRTFKVTISGTQATVM